MTGGGSWTPGVVALALGLVVGAWIAFNLKRKEGEAPSDTALIDLEERARGFIDQLRDLEDQEDRLEPVAYAAEKSRFEQLAAEALRDRDAHLAGGKVKKKTKPKAAAKTATKAPQKKEEAAPASAGLSQLKGFLWGAGLVGVIAALAFMVNVESAPRPEGGSVTGNSTMMQAPSGSPKGPVRGGGMGGGKIGALQTKIDADPKDVESRVELAKMYLRMQRFNEAKSLTSQVLALDPNNAQAQVYQAVLMTASGDTTGALAALNDVLKKHPDSADGWFFRGMMGMQSGNTDLHMESWKKFVEVAPDGPQKDRIRGFLNGEGLQMPGQN